MEPRTLTTSTFAGDSGDADPALTAVLRAAADDPARLPEVLAALHRVRVLTPVLAVGAEMTAGRHGLATDSRANIAVPLLEGTDGRRALPVFSSVVAMAAWDASARPVPVEGRRAALVAVSEGAEVLVVDLAGPVTCVLEEVEMRALAQGVGAVPAYDDVEITRGIVAQLESRPEIVAAWLDPAAGADARLSLQLAEHIRPDQAAAVLTVVARGLADDVLVRGAAVRGLEVALAAPGTTGGRQILAP